MAPTIRTAIREPLLPKALAAVHPEHRTPQAAIVIQSLLTLVLAATGTFEQLAILANVSALALYFGCAVAAWRLREPDTRTQVLGLVPWIACGVIAWLLTGVTSVEWLGFVICIVVASLVYVLTRTARAPVK